ncbi:gamma-glutamyl kinase [Jannaschia sp. Os4]|uniref:gamma-glutamyl kinase n=1 Tax=Jannaschia sp. Os4 TaxID=2807617 RepID=UPI00193A11AF|nr:gamma-glutamyl kinase [Jannaschia sp. Os4]MBM2576640.1 gamma-glutamyl kinase [Jannaschia sp. Os4]
MLVFWKARIVLLAVPKTGTTALEAALAPHADVAILNPPGLKHCTVPKWRRECSAFFEQKGRRPLALVACAREPVDWLGSWWRYRARPDIDGTPNSTAGIPFDRFVEDWLRDDPPPHARVGRQAKFLEGGVDHLFRYEAMDRLVAFLSDRLDRPIDLERRNVSPGGQVDLSPAIRARLEAERAEEFETWAAAS